MSNTERLEYNARYRVADLHRAPMHSMVYIECYTNDDHDSYDDIWCFEHVSDFNAWLSNRKYNPNGQVIHIGTRSGKIVPIEVVTKAEYKPNPYT